MSQYTTVIKRGRAKGVVAAALASAVVTVVVAEIAQPDLNAAARVAPPARLSAVVENDSSSRRRVAVPDPWLNKGVAEVDLPAAWLLESHVDWQLFSGAGAAHPVAVSAALRDPALGASIHLLPKQVFTPPEGLAADYSPGATIAGLTVRPKLSAQQALERLYLAAVYQDQPDALIVAARPDPEYAGLRARQRQQLMDRLGRRDRVGYSSAARLEIEYLENGRKMRDLVRAVVWSRVDPASGLEIWQLDEITSLRAPAQRIRGFESMAEQVLTSLEFNPGWVLEVEEIAKRYVADQRREQVVAVQQAQQSFHQQRGMAAKASQ